VHCAPELQVVPQHGWLLPPHAVHMLLAQT
jgi:hypothetical protein